jgi:hypothetical protein
MRDGRGRRLLKAGARALFYANLVPYRLLRRLRRQDAYVLGGECRRCARCCERPSIRASALVWHTPLLRRIFLFWQQRVNGFVLEEVVRHERVFVFSCTHFDWTTRTCDSYESRPGMCRDYPRVLLQQPLPELLDGCGYKPLVRNAARFRQALDAHPMTEEQRARLRRDLHLDA